MAVFSRPGVELCYDVYGSGFPLLIFAPGGLNSNVAMLAGGPGTPYPDGPPWMDPRVALADRFTVITMDQRNAGRSTAGWTRGTGGIAMPRIISR